MSLFSYCLVCKDDTKNKYPELKKKSGKLYMQSTCSDCGKHKSRLITSKTQLLEESDEEEDNEDESNDSDESEESNNEEDDEEY